MKFKREHLLIGALVLLAVVIGLRLDTAVEADPHTEAPPNAKLRERMANHTPMASIVDGMAIPSGEETIRRDTSTMARRRELERLRLKWLELGPGDGQMDQRVALATETIESLMCTAEMHELSSLLDRLGIQIGPSGGGLYRLAADIFNGPHAEEARELLLEALRAGLPKRSTLDPWCEAAGLGCPPEDFQAFYQRVAEISNELGSSVVYGRRELLFKSDPNAALEELLEAMKDNDKENDRQKGDDAYRLVHILRDEELVGHADFEALADTLEQYDPKNERYWVMGVLLSSWGKSNPAEAVNRIMAHPEKYPAKLIEQAVSSARISSESALLWVDTFPPGE